MTIVKRNPIGVPRHLLEVILRDKSVKIIRLFVRLSDRRGTVSWNPVVISRNRIDKHLIIRLVKYLGHVLNSVWALRQATRWMNTNYTLIQE